MSVLTDPSLASTACCMLHAAVPNHLLPAVNTKIPECFHALPYEMYMRHPLRYSRVMEAVTRTVDLSRITHIDDMTSLLECVFCIAEMTSPEGAAPSTDLLRNKALALRSCSQQISALKVVMQPMPLFIQQKDVLWLQVRVASYVAMVAPIVHSWARGECARAFRRRLGFL